MGLFDSLRRTQGDAEPERHSGYYPLHDGIGDPAYDDWDERFDHADRQADQQTDRAERRRTGWWSPAHYRGRRKRWWAVRILAAILFAFILLIAWLAITAPISKSLQPVAPPQVTLLASDGTPIARSGAMVGEPVAIETLPSHVPEAFLAIEDRRFRSHWGVDPRGIARAAWTGVGGGSTITQQLAKFTFLTPERSLARKAQEALIAVWLEAWLTKDEILERYLSNAYFGDNQYGLRAASLHYFYRQPENLLPQQAAMLAGLLQAPSRYAPSKHYDRAKARMDLVIGAMVEEGYLTQAEADALPPPKLDLRAKEDLPTGTYFADWALPLAREGLERGYSRPVITTTLDARLQTLAGQVTSRAAPGDAQVALVAMRPNGEVVAMVGGKDYGGSPFNRATQAKRQPGSTFKLFVYLAALRKGWEPSDTIDNTPITQGAYRPGNAGGRYSDEITLEDAFARSSNVAAVRLLGEVGGAAVARTARDLGVTSSLAEDDPTLALGTSSLTLLELTAAYAGVAANRFPVVPHAFPIEEKRWWNWITDRSDTLSDRTHDDIEQLLRAAVNRGTGSAAKLSIANFGKTGTTQDYRDALFVGYAGDLVVGVWVGNDDNSPLNGVTGGSVPARIWKDFMREALSVSAASEQAAPDPEGPVQPLDIEDGQDIPLGEGGTSLRFDENGVIISQDGAPADLRIDENGFRVEPNGQDNREFEREIERMERELQRTQERIERETERLRER